MSFYRITALVVMAFLVEFGSLSPSWSAVNEESGFPVSNAIESVAEGLDHAISGDTTADESNKTKIRAEYSTYWSEGGEFRSQPHFGVDLHLPSVEKYWAVKFDTYNEREEDRRLDQRVFRRSPRQDSPGATIAFLQKIGDIETGFEPRVEFNNPLGMSYLLNFKSFADMESYTLRPKLEFFARPDRGTGVFASVELVFILAPAWSLSLINEGEYQDNLNLFNSNSGFNFTQTLSEKSWMSYGLAFHSFNRPSYHLERYGAAITWNYWIYRESLLSTLIPSLTFERENRFKGRTALQYNIRFIF